ncbi:MAG: hypothetical protein JWP97_5425 [Labilithrix sp.]|nr:hypothetical protein [Labilithrix sp.]
MPLQTLLEHCEVASPAGAPHVVNFASHFDWQVAAVTGVGSPEDDPELEPLPVDDELHATAAPAATKRKDRT